LVAPLGGTPWFTRRMKNAPPDTGQWRLTHLAEGGVLIRRRLTCGGRASKHRPLQQVLQAARDGCQQCGDVLPLPQRRLSRRHGRIRARRRHARRREQRLRDGQLALRPRHQNVLGRRPRGAHSCACPRWCTLFLASDWQPVVVADATSAVDGSCAVARRHTAQSSPGRARRDASPPRTPYLRARPTHRSPTNLILTHRRRRGPATCSPSPARWPPPDACRRTPPCPRARRTTVAAWAPALPRRRIVRRGRHLSPACE